MPNNKSTDTDYTVLLPKIPANEKKLPPKTFSQICILGDSLSDSGALNKKKLLGFIPMSWLSGLSKDSTLGRFTNVTVWSDDLRMKLATSFFIKDLKKRGAKFSSNDIKISPSQARLDALDLEGASLQLRKSNSNINNTDIADAVLDGELSNKLKEAYALNDESKIPFYHRNFIRNYAEGGLTAHNYSWAPSYSIKRFFSRITLSSLAKKTNQLITDDQIQNESAKKKKETLIIEWSGANDLITVNKEPSVDEALLAVYARMENIKKLYESGYRNFCLFNLPDLSLTPRYQKKSEKEQKNARAVTDFFNEALKRFTNDFKNKHPDADIQIFDVNKQFKKMYENPEKYGLKNKETSFVDDRRKANQDPKDRNIPDTEKHMFWDDVHPSGKTHLQLMLKFLQINKNTYQFIEPREQSAHELIEQFTKKRRAKMNYGPIGFFKSFIHHSKLPDYQKETDDIQKLVMIFKHALIDNGKRTREILVDLGWINQEGNIFAEENVALQKVEAILKHSNPLLPFLRQ